MGNGTVEDTPFYIKSHNIIPFKKVKTFIDLRPGATLNNDALVLGWKESDNNNIIVLAMNERCEFVTWRLDENCNACGGRYFDRIIDAVEDFKERE